MQSRSRIGPVYFIFYKETMRLSPKLAVSIAQSCIKQSESITLERFIHILKSFSCITRFSTHALVLVSCRHFLSSANEIHDNEVEDDAGKDEISKGSLW